MKKSRFGKEKCFFSDYTTIFLTSSFLLYMPVFAALAGGKVALYHPFQAPAGGKVALAVSKVLDVHHWFNFLPHKLAIGLLWRACHTVMKVPPGLCRALLYMSVFE